jgi:hypothetical protein
MFTVHATAKVAVTRQPLNPQMLEEAIERPIMVLYCLIRIVSGFLFCLFVCAFVLLLPWALARM